MTLPLAVIAAWLAFNALVAWTGLDRGMLMAASLSSPRGWPPSGISGRRFVMHDRVGESQYLTLPEQANFLAARTIAYATAFLDGRNDAAELAIHAEAVQCEIRTFWSDRADVAVNAILVPVQLLVDVMRFAAVAIGDVRQDRLQSAMGSLVELVRNEANELRNSGAQRS